MTKLTRKDFLRLTATGLGALAGGQLLAGCSPAPAATALPASTAVPGATAAATTAPTATATPLPKPTRRPTATPPPPATPIRPLRRPDVIKMYPAVKSKVVEAHHAGVWSDKKLVPNALGQMLDASITKLTGLNDATEAWQALFLPNEKIAIKVNAFRNSLIWTHAPLVTALTGRLVAAGLPAENITIFDFLTEELETAGYTINKDGPGVRCFGTKDTPFAGLENFSGGWQVGNQSDVPLSNILLQSDALINIPVLKSHMLTGLTFALKNHYGSVPSPDALHYTSECLPALNALLEIKNRTRLVIGDMLAACVQYAEVAFPYWQEDWIGDSILMSFDPLANDAVGYQQLVQLQTERGMNVKSIKLSSETWFKNAGELGVGANAPEQMEVVDFKLS